MIKEGVVVSQIMNMYDEGGQKIGNFDQKTYNVWPEPDYLAITELELDYLAGTGTKPEFQLGLNRNWIAFK